jgi:hypothetical protein
LTIARGLPRTHGGDLTAASPGLGRGTTFSAQFTKDVPIHTAAEHVQAGGVHAADAAAGHGAPL